MIHRIFILTPICEFVFLWVRALSPQQRTISSGFSFHLAPVYTQVYYIIWDVTIVDKARNIPVWLDEDKWPIVSLMQIYFTLIMKNNFAKLKIRINGMSRWILFERGLQGLMCGYFRGRIGGSIGTIARVDIWWSEQHKKQLMGHTPPRSSIMRGKCYL